MYSLSYDADARLFTIEMEGFWSSLTVARFGAEVVIKGVALRARHRRFGLLVNCRGFPVQSGSVIEGFVPLLRRAQSRGITPVAIVVETALCKLQAERLMPDKSIRVFIDTTAARDWIDSVRAEERQAA